MPTQHRSAMWNIAGASVVVIALGMGISGIWLTHQVRNGLLENVAYSSALFMDRYIEPAVQELANSDRLSNEAIETLDQAVKQRLIAEHLVSAKIWRLDGTIVYAKNKEAIGRKYAIEGGFLEATHGNMAVEFADLRGNESSYERLLGKTLIEVYVPLYDRSDNRLIAVSEFYLDAALLRIYSSDRLLQTWLLLGLTSIVMLLVMSQFIFRCDRDIKRQGKAMGEKVAQLSYLLKENRELGEKVDAAARDAVTIVEQHLGAIGAELHDGPAQCLAVASLRLSALNFDTTQSTALAKENKEILSVVQLALTDAMREIRSISSGLSVPELVDLDIRKTLTLAVRSHERRTGTTVECKIDSFPEPAPMAVKLCLYRFVQEGLNNAFRHAKTSSATVIAWLETKSIVVEVSDNGSGFIWDGTNFPQGTLGLSGLRIRIATLGGEFSLHTQPGIGTRIIAQLPIATNV